MYGLTLFYYSICPCSLCCDVSIYRWIYRISRKKTPEFPFGHLCTWLLFFFQSKDRYARDILKIIFSFFDMGPNWYAHQPNYSPDTSNLYTSNKISKPSTHTCKVTGIIEFEYFFLKVKEDICQRNFYIFSFFDLGQIFRFQHCLLSGYCGF